jgi:hypothetical protein
MASWEEARVQRAVVGPATVMLRDDAGALAGSAALRDG